MAALESRFPKPYPTIMDESSVVKYITDTFRGMDLVTADGNYFFFYDPEGNTPPDHRFPFVTLVTNDKYDQASKLDRPGVFRLNIGVSKAAYQTLFAARPGATAATAAAETGHDFTALDQIMPHPIYGNMFWICVLSPTAATFEKIRPLLAEAYARAAA
jgi:hypothetical protein